ncbi:MAG: hypothetical protein PHU25_13755 [Deltaproteobacteria bacterium]|nr:hypothetical protein [Deltaproteobacteria bacterium]
MFSIVFTTLLPARMALAQGPTDAGAPAVPPAPTDGDCLQCHGDKGLSAATERGKKLTLFVAPDALKRSVHKDLSCTDCHGGAKTFSDAPHNDGKPLELKCGDCHDKEAAEYKTSIHGSWAKQGDKDAATCADCHGSHDILPSSDRGSLVNKFRLHLTCGKCHQNKTMMTKHELAQPQAVENYMDSIHGRGLLEQGLVVAPSCSDCHTAHRILPHTYPESSVGKDNIPKTCGKCHALVEEVYDKSIHGQLAKNHDARGPVCNTCHTSHSIETASGPEFRLHSDRMCGKCHMDRLTRYRDTFHGKALALGRSEVAACYDCHGHHDIVKESDPGSRINPANRVATCRKCHPNAGPKFAGYIVHADHTNKKDYPALYYAFWFMTLLLIGTFAFFAVHTAMWLYRSVSLYMGDSKDFRELKKRIRDDREQYVRFRPLERFLHGLIITSFLLLVLSGMPLKFFDTSWAKVMLSVMGGQAVASVLHRAAAIIMVFAFCVHVLNTLFRFVKRRANWTDPQTGRFSMRQIGSIVFGPDSPMPTLQDLKDIVAHNRWFFGKGKKPQFDRWTYWEKFDYLAVFWGIAIIGFSGLVMWFPESFTRLLPGWIINVAHIVHSDEALLAAGFIFTFHFFNVHFRPEKFPMDHVIFSGRISRTEMLEERERQWKRWEKEGRTEELRVGGKDEWDSWKWIALPAGFIAFCLGLLLVLLIYWAMAARLTSG